MSFDKRKYVYFVVAIVALATLYVVYSLIKYGSPTIKSQNEFLVDANKLHNDSLFEEAVEFYMKAGEFEKQQSLVNYNTAVNSIMKNYKPLERLFNGESYVLDSTIIRALDDAAERLKKSTETESKAKEYSSAFHNIGVLNHMRNQLETAAEAYKEALRKNPADEDTRYNLAVVLYLMKQYQQQNQSPQGGSGLQGNGQEQQEQEKQEEKEEKEKMEQMLKALRQDEKEIREKMEETEKVKVRDSYIEKNW